MTELHILLVAVLVPLGVALLAFWLWMLIDCLRDRTRSLQERILWALGIVFFKLVGAAVYYFCRYRPARQSMA